MQYVGLAGAAGVIPEDRDRDADSALVLAAQRDPAAFEALYVRYARAVFRYCDRRLDDPESAADATAAVFERAWTALPRFRDRSFRAWLFRIAHNEVIDHYRRATRRRHVPLEAAAEVPAPGPSLEDLSELADERATIDGLLARLPEAQRRVVELRLAGLDGTEIAFALGRTREAVKMLQFRAMRNLRSALAALAEPDEMEDDDARG